MPSATEDTDDSADLRPVAVQKWDSASVWARAKKLSVDEQDGISPLMLAKSKEVDDFDLDVGTRYYNAYLAKRMSSRKSSASSSPSAWQSYQTRPTAGSQKDSPVQGESDSNQRQSRSNHHLQASRVDALLDEVVSWLHAEKAKKKARKAKRKAGQRQTDDSNNANLDGTTRSSASPGLSRRGSDVSDDGSPDLEMLESILEKGLGESQLRRRSSKGSSRNLKRYGSRSSRLLRRQSTYRSSDTEYYEDDALVPSCDAILDCSRLSNSNTSGVVNSDPNLESGDTGVPASVAQDPWSAFKYEIVRLAHTLKLKSWRQLPLSNSGEITVDRLSGALTNAVYVVSPPRDLPAPKTESRSGASATRKRKQPSKLILRIYGPHVEHLIDRESELQVLRRLARKHIGPRLLGTFRNGRFEEFFNAQALRPQDLRVPETSKQIAKRMRELHDGIELLREERIDGPFVWKNWNKWVGRAEKLATRADFLVHQQMQGKSRHLSTSKLRGFVCGTTWKFFRQMVEKYRKELDTLYGSRWKLMEQLVFAHNDTQYGNILRIEPPGESPLLLPANEHKQLVVIDFEYANANVPGFEFANHFTEWCYNYHDPEAAFKCNTAHYPSPDEQYRFIRAYVMHRPQHTPAAPSTPRFTPVHLSRSVSSLALDARNPNAKSTEIEESESFADTNMDTDAAVHAEVQRLMHETQLWRVANSAQWVVWGILQAKITYDLNDENHDSAVLSSETAEKAGVSNKESPVPAKSGGDRLNDGDVRGDSKTLDADSDEEGFDYLNYARERAMFFWGDCLQMGLVTREDLGEDIMNEVKLLSY